MDKQITEKVNKILNLLIDGIEKTGDITQSQLPELINEYVTLYMLEALPVVSTVLAIILGIVTYVIVKLCLISDNTDIRENGSLISGTVGTILILAFLLSSLNGFKNIYIIKTAPKAYLIEKLRK